MDQIRKQPRENPQSSGPASTGVAIQRMLNVMHAVILRDIRSRFFNHGLGFLVVPLLPVAHIAILLTIYTVTGRKAIYGEDLALFFATGLVPALTFSYISRQMAFSVMSNKNMLSFPAVRLLDIMLARSFLELIGIILSIFCISVILLTLGSSLVPVSPEDAILAMICAISVAIGVGIIVSVISAIAPVFAMIYSLSVVIIYLSSGAPIYLHVFPAQLTYWCSFSPVFQTVEWMRSAYYLGYPTQNLDKNYLIMWSLLTPAAGLLLERLVRRQVLNGN